MNAALFCANTFASFGRHDGERVNRIGSISSVGRNRLPVKVYPVSQPSLERVSRCFRVLGREKELEVNRKGKEEKKKKQQRPGEKAKSGFSARSNSAKKFALGGFRWRDKTFRGIGFKAGNETRWGTGSLKRDQLYTRFYLFFDPYRVFESELGRKFKERFQRLKENAKFP